VAWSFAVTLVDPAVSSSIAIIPGAAKPATHPLFLVIVLFPFQVDVLADLVCLAQSLAVSQGLSQLPPRASIPSKAKTP
jgi:hypothetical protein